LPILGKIAAGTPIEAIQHERDRIPVPESLLGAGEHYVLEVQGDSMINAGILAGDMVVVRPQDTATDGDIVVALLGEDATVKRFFREPDHIRLQPENDSMEPIRSREVQVLGRVVGVMRKVA
jgi:repressor LexA